MLLAHLAASGVMVYNWVWIIVGVVTVLGAVLAGLRYVGKRAVRNSKLDLLLHEITVNGGDSLSVGDTIARTEHKVDQLIATVAEQKGHNDAVEQRVLVRLDNLETRTQVEARAWGVKEKLIARQDLVQSQSELDHS